MSESSTVSLALLAGVLLGMIFFGGLWWTIQTGVSSKQPAVWFSGSFLLRTFIALPASISSRMAIGADCWLACLDFSLRASW